jgi:putative transcriptional regulator
MPQGIGSSNLPLSALRPKIAPVRWTMKTTIHNQVHEFRTASGLTQEALAERVRVTRQTIIAIEGGNYTPSVTLALKIAKVFGTSVEKVFRVV